LMDYVLEGAGWDGSTETAYMKLKANKSRSADNQVDTEDDVVAQCGLSTQSNVLSHHCTMIRAGTQLGEYKGGQAREPRHSQ
jgi:hypothetical protein